MDNRGFFSSTADVSTKQNSSPEDFTINTNTQEKQPRRKNSKITMRITADDFSDKSDHTSEKRSLIRKLGSRFHPKRLIPALEWMPNYQASYLKDDLVAAITVAIMHVPQGLAYGQLAGVAAVQGLYVSTFPSLVYAFLGTGKHVSIGTFAVIALLIRSAIPDIKEQILVINGNVTQIGDVYSTNQIITTLATVVGLLQVITGILSLGTLSVLLSEPMLSGFTTGAATHVVASQLKGLFDINVGRRKGIFKVILTFYDVVIRIQQLNPITTVVSISAIIFICLGQSFNQRCKANLFMPLPVELIVVIIVTLISYFTDMHDQYGSEIMGDVPTGLPPITIPAPEMFRAMLQQAFVIAFISYVICLSLGKTFARRNGYRVDANQELIAMGAANVISSFLDCFPCAASLSRSSLQEKLGCKTQLASIISSGLLILIILFAGPLFFYLPKCVLSSIIIVALKGMVLQVNDCFRYAKVSLMEAVVWMGTFLTCFVLDLEYGIAAGAICTVGALLYRDSKPRVRFVVTPPGCRELSETMGLSGVHQVSIIRVESEINFINRDALKESFLRQIDQSHTDQGRLLVIDLSSSPYIDCSGCTAIQEILAYFTHQGFYVCVVGADEGVTESVTLSGNSRVTFSTSLKEIDVDDLSTESCRF